MKERKWYMLGRRVALVAMSLCLSMLFTGCGDDDDGGGEAGIAGTWVFDDGSTLALTADGSATYTDPDGSVENYSYMVSGNTLTATDDEYDNNGNIIGTGTSVITISGNTLTETFTVNFDDGSPDFVENFTATRQ